MVNVCERCKIAEKHKYWNEFPPKMHHFFKVLLGEFEHQLRIPRKFVECFKGTLSNECSLRGPSGHKWMVEVERTQVDLVFSSGWDDFVRDHGLKISDFLVFQYVGNSSFEVLIFDASGCEREGAHFVSNNQNFMVNAGCISSLHNATGCSNPWVEEFSSEEQDSWASMDVSVEKEEEVIMNGVNPRDTNTNKGKAKGKRMEMSRSEGKRKITSSLQEDEEGDEEEEEESFTGEIGGRSPRSRLNLRRSRAPSKAKQSHICYRSNRRTPTKEEKLRAYKMALCHIDRNRSRGAPMVIITMLPTHVYSGFHLTIPKEWATQHMLRERHQVMLQVPEDNTRSWTVGCRWNPSQCQFIAKWSKFVLENNLEEHDVCVFELLQKGDVCSKRNTVFNVHIFRAVSDIAPLTVERCVT